MSFTCVDVAKAAGLRPGRRVGSEQAFACTRHHDEHPSLMVNDARNVWLCGPCGMSGTPYQLAAFLAGADPADKPAVLAWLRTHSLLNGCEPATEIAYSYTDEAGNIRFQVVRRDGKRFSQRRPDPNGGWINDVQGVQRVLYRLPELRRADVSDVFIVEGERDADTLHRLGLTATTNPGGAGKWRSEFAGAFRSDHHVVVIPDNDAPGRVHAQQIAASLLDKVASLKILELPGVPEKGDVSDFIATFGDPMEAAEALVKLADAAPVVTQANVELLSVSTRETLGQATMPESPALAISASVETLAHENGESHCLRIQRAADVMAAPRPKEIIRDLAYAECLSVVASESGVGKTFVALSAAAAVSDGRSWHGRDTSPGSVVYCAFEGDALGLRLRALREVSGHRLDDLYIIRCSEPLSPRITRDGETRSVGEVALATAIYELSADLRADGRPPIVLTVIDTVRASMTGSEDSSEHVSAYLRAVRRILAPLPGAGAILVHHAGWQDGEERRKRERGSSAFRGNVDATHYLELGTRDAETGQAELTLRTLKLRDAERPAPLRLIRRRVTLNERDGHGQPVTSCIIEPDRRTHTDREAEQVRVAEAADLALDRRILGVIRDREVTSNTALRSYVGARHAAVVDAVSRILRAGWATKASQRHPFVLTTDGRSVLTTEES